MKGSITKVKNMDTAEMVSTFELDDAYLDKLSLKHFEFNEYGLYIDKGVLNDLIQLKPFSFTVPVHQVSQPTEKNNHKLKSRMLPYIRFLSLLPI